MLRACRHSLSTLQIRHTALLSSGLTRPLGFGEVYWRLWTDLTNLCQLWTVWEHQGQNIRALKRAANLRHAFCSICARNLPVISGWFAKAAAHYAISAWDCPQGKKKKKKWRSSVCSSEEGFIWDHQAQKRQREILSNKYEQHFKTSNKGTVQLHLFHYKL